MLGGSILLDKYSRHIADDIEAGGFDIEASLFNVIEGGNHVAMAKTACLTALEFTNSLYTSVAGRGGDLRRSVRAARDRDGRGLPEHHDRAHRGRRRHRQHRRERAPRDHQARAPAFRDQRRRQRRVLAMGEDPRYVFNTGSLDVELAAHVSTTITNEQVNALGVGHDVDIEQPFLMVVQHPVTTEADNRAHLETTLRAVAALDLPTIWFWPNPDAGTGEMADSLRHMREQHPELTANMRFITNVPANDFVALLAHAACLVGNSSAGIKECSFLGTPVVNIGDRQQGRLTGEHVAHVGYDADRDRRRDRHAAGARPLRAVAHLLPAERQPDDRRRAGDDAALHAEAVSRQ